MPEDGTKERKTATGEPAQGHHGAHEKPNAPYGREVQIHNEHAKRLGQEPADREPADDREDEAGE